MALTAQNIVDVRRWLGYSVTGNTTSAPYRELVYSDVAYLGLSIEYRLGNLSAEEESVMTTYLLPNLAKLEAAVLTASDNLATDVAAVWKHNKNEVGDRRALFNSLRRDLCDFLGFPPGHGLRSGRVVRC